MWMEYNIFYWFWKALKVWLFSVEICDVNDVRSGWLTDGFQRVAAKARFSTKHEVGYLSSMPAYFPAWLFDPCFKESTCFSIMFQRLHKLIKSVDLVADTSENQRVWQIVIKHLVNKLKTETVHFNEEK